MTTGRIRLPNVLTSDHPMPWLLPMVAMLLVFTIYPLLYNIWLSFHEYAPMRRSLEFVGAENWTTLWADERFWGAMRVTFTYFAVVLSIELALGMALALLLDSDAPGYGFLRAVLTLTLVIPPAVTGMMFLLMQDAEFGVITYVLQGAGLIGPTSPILSSARSPAIA